MTTATLGLAFLAGILSVLSPCVLPLLPVVLGTAASEHRAGPALLASGLAVSFITIGVFVATIGFAIGLDSSVFRTAAGALLIAIGVVLALPRLQERVAVASSPLAAWVDRKFGGSHASGLTGQFGVGLLLGAVWTPCVGPTLGAATVLASQGTGLGQVAATMGAFGVGAALPLLILGLFSRQLMSRMRKAMLGTGGALKLALGIVLVAVGVLVLTGLDKVVEAALVEASPEWLTHLTTRY